MESRVYLVFNRQGFVRAAKGGRKWDERTPALESGERAVRLVCKMPDAVFGPAGIPTVSVDVEEGHVRFPMPEPEVAITPAETVE